MTDFQINSAIAKLRRIAAGLPLYARALALRATHSAPPAARSEWRHLLGSSNTPALRKGALALAIVGAAGMLSCAGLWWRLGSGPLAVDMATPWLASALEERFGGRHRIEVGGTQLERDDDGRTAIRLRDIVVRDAAGSVVATAPKAEVGITLTSLMMGHVRPERLSLIGAEMAVRIERDGQLMVFARGEQKPFTTASASSKQPLHRGFTASMADTAAAAPSQNVPAAAPNLLAVLLEWLQNLDAVGLDGGDLIEIGLKSGSIAVDDQRNGKLLNFPNIDLSLTRPKEGGAALALSSMGTDGPWSINATVVPRGDGLRAIDAVIRDVSPKDILLALRLGSGDLETDVPLSAVIRAEIDKDGMPQSLDGRIIAGAGYIGDIRGPDARLLIDEAQLELRWDAANRQLNVPIEIQSGANRILLTSSVQPPGASGGPWSFAISQGRIQLASIERPNEPPMLLDRVTARGGFNTATGRIELAQADLRGPTGGVAISGALDFSGAEPRLNFGVAGSRMTATTFKRLWPVVFAPGVRSWIETHVQAGTIEKLTIAGNATWDTLRPKGPPIPQDGLSINIESSGITITPVDGLPAVRDVDLVARITGRTAVVNFARGNADLPSGKRLSVSNGTFEVADTKAPMSRTKFRLEGPVDAVNELIGMEPLRDSTALPYDPGAMRGSLMAQVSVGVPLKKELQKSTEYAVDAELTGFSAEKFIRGQKAEAAMLRLSANQQLMQLKGDMKIGGTPTAVDVKKLRAETDAEVRMQATLDDAARTRMGIDLGNTVTGPVPVKIGGRMKFSEKESKLSVEADLTQARVTDLFPGWIKAPGRPGRATFTLLDKGQATRIEDLVLESPGVSVKGAVELDSEGEIVNANFPTFGLTDGDKANLKAERATDGTLKVTLRGDLYDGRGFIKSTVASKPDKAKRSANDLDLDIKLGAVTGHHGEALRSLELRMSRRAGQIRSFSMSGKLGHDAMMTGDLRGRGGGRQVVYLEANDAGALFRFADIYPRIIGGSMSVAMDPPTTDLAPQEGLLNIRDFAVRGEPALDGVASSGPGPAAFDQHGRSTPSSGGVSFSRMRVEFTKSPGRVAMREGIVWGPAVGATVEGHLDYLRDEVRLRGTFVPAYALNNMFGRIPIVGLFLGGGSNEGLLGVTYQVVGSPQSPVLQVNPMSAVAPGFLRKLFEFRGASDQTGAVPEASR